MRSKLVRFPQLEPDYDIPFSRVHLKRLIDDERFPAPVHLGRNTIAWLEEDILAWKDRIRAQRDAKLAARRSPARTGGAPMHQDPDVKGKAPPQLPLRRGQNRNNVIQTQPKRVKTQKQALAYFLPAQDGNHRTRSPRRSATMVLRSSAVASSRSTWRTASASAGFMPTTNG